MDGMIGGGSGGGGDDGEGWDDGEGMEVRCFVLDDGSEVDIVLEPSVWDAIESMCRKEEVEVPDLVKATVAVCPGEDPGAVLYRAVLRHFMKAAMGATEYADHEAISRPDTSDAVVEEARRRRLGQE